MNTVFFIAHWTMLGILGTDYEFRDIGTTPAIQADGEPYHNLVWFPTEREADAFCAGFRPTNIARPFRVTYPV